MMGWYQGGWGAMGVVGMVSMVVVWGTIIGIAVWAIARITRTDQVSGGSHESARAIVDRRFAAGEIGPEEYARYRRTLESGEPTDLTSSAS